MDLTHQGAALEQVRKTKIGRKRAESLLYPVATFLLAGGMTQVAARNAFVAAMARARKLAGRQIDHIGHPSRYADVVAKWAHDGRFVDRNGAPRPLSFNGANGFESLVASVDRSLDARETLGVLVRYGTVRKCRSNRYALVSPFFSTSSRRSMAFEPMAYFLSDASSTLGRILDRTNTSRGPELFWRKVETTGLSLTAVNEFTEFAAARSLGLLEELDDWLEARRRLPAKGSRKEHKIRRVGLGLFCIYSNPEIPTE